MSKFEGNNTPSVLPSSINQGLILKLVAASLVAPHRVPRRNSLPRWPHQNRVGTLCLWVRPLVMGTGCVGCGVIVFISRCSEFGFVACVCRGERYAQFRQRATSQQPTGSPSQNIPESVLLRVTSRIQHRQAMAGWRWACPGREQQCWHY